MAGVVPATYQEAMMKMMQQLASAMAAPDANLDALTQLQGQILAQIRKPVDTPTPGTPVGAGMDMSQGAQAPPPGAPMPGGGLSPMLQALLAAGQGGPMPGGAMPGGPPAAAPGSFPAHGLMAGPGAPNMDELRRTLSIG